VNPYEFARTNDAVLLSAIEALLTAAHILHLVTDRNVSVLAGLIDAFPRRILVRDCCDVDARRLLAEAGLGHDILALDESHPQASLTTHVALIVCPRKNNFGGVMKTPRRRFLRLAGVAAALPAVSRLASAQTSPIRPIVVGFSLPVDLLAQIHARLIDGSLEVTAQDPNGKDLAGGKLAVVDNRIDPASGTVHFKATFDNTNEVLRPGQFVNVRVLGYTAIGQVLR
jgi:multidrug efflux pump subunit AcrA (membrane-fusion protein)